MCRGHRVFVQVVAFTILATACRAELLMYDPFLIGTNPSAGEYTLGQLVNQNPTIGPVFPPFLEGPWTSRSPEPSSGHIVQAGQITDSPYPSPGGSVRATISLEGARAGRYLDTPLGHTTTGVYFLGMLINFGASEQPTDGMGFRIGILGSWSSNRR